MNKQPFFELFYPPPELFELVVDITIGRQPPRKSNQRRVVRNPKTGVLRVIKSENALDYAKWFLTQVPADAKLSLGSLMDPLFLLAEVYYASNRPDLSVELIKDLLQEAGVVKDDRYVKGELLFARVDKDYPRTHIRLYRMRTADKNLGYREQERSANEYRAVPFGAIT